MTNEPVSFAPARALPYPPLLRRVLRESALLWLGVRCMYVLLLAFGKFPPGEFAAAALHPTPRSRLLLVASTAFLVWLDRRRAHEHLLQSNFGVSPLGYIGASVLAAGALDLVLQAILGAL